eukprot:GHVH01016779.1.p2 GENE.GHVH01016779.1~~GHVH01016779.1.p2  ORF type:complete len:733 (+),score=96.24 GHVH01016779.1:4348-6546(+)
MEQAKTAADLVQLVGKLLLSLVDRRHLAMSSCLNASELRRVIALSHPPIDLKVMTLSSAQQTYLQILALSCLEEITHRSISMKLSLLDRWDDTDDVMLGDTDHQVIFINSSALRHACSALEAERMANAVVGDNHEILILDPRSDAKLRKILNDALRQFSEPAKELSQSEPHRCFHANSSDESPISHELAASDSLMNALVMLLRDIKKFVNLKLRNMKNRNKSKSALELRQYLGDLSTPPRAHHSAILFKVICDLLGLRCSYHRVYREECITQKNDDVPLHRNFVRMPISGRQDTIISVTWESFDNGAEKRRTKCQISDFWRKSNDSHNFAAIHQLDDILTKIDTKPSSKRPVKTPPLIGSHIEKNAPEAVVNLDKYFTFYEKMGQGAFGQVFAVSAKTTDQFVVSEPARKRRRVSQIGCLSPSDMFFTGGRAISVDDSLPRQKKFALKIIKLSDANDLSDVEDEVSILKMFNHPRLVPCYNVFLGNRDDRRSTESISSAKQVVPDVKSVSLCCLMELCDSSLEDVFIGKYVIPESPGPDATHPSCSPWVLPLLLDSCRGMSHLHDPRQGMGNTMILHRDLKPGNILLSVRRGISGPPLVRGMIADFGVATVRPLRDLRYFREAFSPLTQEPGTHAYMAPEQAKTGAYDRPADVYAFGIVVLRFLGIEEFKREERAKKLGALLDNLTDMPGDRYLQQLASRCLAEEPHNRPSFPDIVRSLVLEMMSRGQNRQS